MVLHEAGHLEQLIEVLGGKDDVLVPAVSGRATGAGCSSDFRCWAADFRRAQRPSGLIGQVSVTGDSPHDGW